MKKEIGPFFILLALISLLGGMFFGSISAFQFVFPDFLKEIPFLKNRPLHVSLVVAWIFLSSVGGIYYYLPKYCGLPLFSQKMAKAHLWLFIITGLAIISSYLLGKFGGREYWEFPALLAIPIIISWILFGINFFKTVFKKVGQWPVYLWMWATGICFFLFTFMESYLWIFPYFGEHVIRDLTVQWKSYGSLVGSWNMLVYGTAIFVMERVKGDTTIATSRLSFLMYLLGLTNLMFGWAHHIYILPSAPWIRYLAYVISMTEWIILAKIIWNWKSSLNAAKKDFHFIPYRFLVASEVWIFLNIILALLISIPAINIYTHGTHITVAHAMGSSIGINTMILLASALFIVRDISGHTLTTLEKKFMSAGFWIANISLFLFLTCLIIAGIEKGSMVVANKMLFQEIMQEITPWLLLFAYAGLGLFGGLLMTAIPPLRSIFAYIRNHKL